MKMFHVISLSLVLILATSNDVRAGDDTPLPLPRFVTIKASEANTRTGPSVRYPIRFSYQRASLPVEIIAEVDQWRKIRDKDGDEGWIHHSLLSGRRSVIITGKSLQLLYQDPDSHARPIIRLEPGVIAQLLTCHQLWCKVEVEDEKGWVLREHVFGVYPHENFDD